MALLTYKLVQPERMKELTPKGNLQQIWMGAIKKEPQQPTPQIDIYG